MTVIALYTDWRAYAKQGEIERLAELYDQGQAAIAERKKIRDRCYQRARRAKGAGK